MWTSEEVRALIEVWGNANVQSQLDGVQRNRTIFEKISKELLKLGYSKTWLQCRTKIKNMTQQYRKVKDGNKITGGKRRSCSYYNELDAILGTRAASAPPLLVESCSSQDDGSSVEPTERITSASSPSSISEAPPIDDTTQHVQESDDDEFDEGGPPEPEADQPMVEADQPMVESQQEDDARSSTTTSTEGRSASRRLAKKKGTKRKREGVSVEVLEMLSELEEKADERWSVMEEKRMRIDAELEEKRRKEERKHELQMHQMFLNCIQTLSQNRSHNSHYTPPPLPTHHTPPPSTPLHSPPSTPHSYNYSASQQGVPPTSHDFYTYTPYTNSD